MKDFERAVQYPAQTGPYKVVVLDKGTWHKFDCARFQISMGNPKHDGEKFFALCEWAAARFEHITLIVSDSLQRHNINLTSGEAAAQSHTESLLLGDQWIFRNKKALDLLPSKTIIRWDHWLSHPDYKATHNRIMNIYSSDVQISNLINEKAREFSKKKSEVFNDFSVQSINEASIRYLIEEMAAFAIMMREEHAADIYPGSWFKDLFEAFSKYKNEDLLSGFPDANYLRVDFVKNKHPDATQALKFGYN